MKVDHRHRQRVDHAITVLGIVKRGKDALTDHEQRVGEGAPSPVEACPIRQMGKEIVMLLPLADRCGFFVPSPYIPPRVPWSTVRCCYSRLAAHAV